MTLTPGQAAGSPRRAQRKGVPVAWVAAVVALLVAGAAGLFVWLAQRPAATPAPVMAQAPPPSQESDTGEQPAPDADAVLARREQVQQLRARLQNRRQALIAQAVKRWAPAEYAGVEQLAAAGEKRFQGHDYRGANSTYAEAVAQATKLLQRADEVLAQLLVDGNGALAAGHAQAAADAFALALALDSDNAAASKGAARAKTLDDVLALMRAGRAREHAGELQAARDAFAKAVQLDGAYQSATAALAGVEQALAERRFQARMSAGLAALQANAYAAARKAFRAAAKIRPQAAAPRDGLAQANAGLQSLAVAGARAAAQAAAAAERWQDAAAAYDRILALDPSLDFARQARNRAAERAELAQALAYHLDHPQRLGAGKVRAAVAALLQRARAVDDPGATQLHTRIAELSGRLAAAAEPVAVRLVSDNRTQVAIFHVGRLGSFKTRRLELTPGEYTAVGHCQGYRDVRVTFSVGAGEPAGPISIRCQERL
ncbi:MAG: hypothetical protein L0H83_07380 [Salinisphaera sp.]|nr:hypothetical protein [Salinisphaera sp.]